MKPIVVESTETDNLPGEEVKFTISKAHEALVMRSLADLYSNRELAVIREYSTNARDAMIEAKKSDQPILVTLPNAMNPYFRVQDSGVGLDRQELREVYTVFGDSSKRETDDQNGMLGFGCKSAVAYTNQFTITAVKNGRKIIGVVSRHEDAMGGYSITLKFVLDVETSEPNGVTVEVPVHNWMEFERKARDFYRYWLPGTVLVNGKQPEWAVGDKIDDNLYYNVNNGSSFVVMGNVPYRIENPDALFPVGMNRISFVAYVPMGAVEFTPNREALKYSDHTKTNLHKIINDFVAKSVSLAKKEIGGAKSHAQAYILWDKWRKLLGQTQVEDLSFKGDKFVDRFPLNGYSYNVHAYRGGCYHISEYQVSGVYNAIIITDFSSGLPGSAQKRKAKAWAAHKNINNSYFVFTNATKISNPWVDQSRVIDWETLKAEAPKAPKKPRSASVAYGRKAGTFDLIGAGTYEAEQDVPAGKELYYVLVKDYNLVTETGTTLKELLRLFDFKHKVVKVPANRKDKFVREYPHAKEILPELKAKIVLDGVSLLSDDAKVCLSTDASERHVIRALDAKRIDDPEAKELIRIMSVDESEYLKEYNRQYHLASALRMASQFKRHPWEGYWNSKKTPLSSKYPLLKSIRRNTLSDNENNHVYIYMNSIFSMRKDGKNV